MKVVIYISTSIIIVYLGYIAGKKEPKVKILEKFVTKTVHRENEVIKQPTSEIIPSLGENIKGTNKTTNVIKNRSTLDQFRQLPSGKEKLNSAERSIDNFLKDNPDDLNDEQANLFAEQMKYILDWYQPEPYEVKEWVYKLSKLKSAEFKTDIFEYMVQARLISTKELEDIVIIH